MGIDFHSTGNRGTYATRTADSGWATAMRAIVDPEGKYIADVGCGGGIYARAWSDLGTASVVGADFSAQMVADARAASVSYPNLEFVQGDAAATGLPAASFDIVFSRAVIHHLPDPEPAFTEALRLLKPGGVLIVQDRTMEDVLRPASASHLRGYFFETLPRLLDIERARRPATARVTTSLSNAGFIDVSTSDMVERRRAYGTLAELQEDLRARTGRSILHALSDPELEDLIAHISDRVDGAFPLCEHDYWTIWSARKPDLLRASQSVASPEARSREGDHDHDHCAPVR